MRRKDKFIATGVLGGIAITALGDILIQWLEHRNKGKTFTWENYNGWRTIKNSAIGGAIGGAIGYGYYRYKLGEEANLPFNSDNYLKKVLSKEHLKADPIAFENILAHRERVKTILVEKFGEKLVTSPQDVGSFHKRTAINSKYDLDIILPFKKGSFSSLEEMYTHVYEELYNSFGMETKVNKQTKAIGITFENDEKPVHFDIVPGREINNYLIDKNLHLYVRPDWSWQTGSSFKTNVSIQKKMTANQPEARRVIKLLKIYNDKSQLELPPVIIEQCVVSALSENNFGVYYSDTQNFLNCMEYISRNMRQKRIIDFANSNNNLNDKLADFQKSRIECQLNSDFNMIKENPRLIQEVFGNDL